MRLADYDFVLDGWQPDDPVLNETGWNLCTHLGLPYVVFYLVMDQGTVNVRCDPCSGDQDRPAYAAMVRSDLVKAIAKRRRTEIAS